MKQLNRWVYAIVGVIVLLFAGLVYAWSVLSTPIGAEFTGWTKAQLSLTFTLVMILFCIGSLLCGLLAGRLSAKNAVRLGAVLFLAGFFIASRCQSPLTLYLGFGVLCGLGSGLSYNAVMSTMVRWFPDRPGLISGVLVGGPLGRRLIVKYDLKPEEHQANYDDIKSVNAAGKEPLSALDVIKNVVVIIVCMALGTMVSGWVSKLIGMSFPNYVGAMFVAVIVRNLNDTFHFYKFSFPLVDGIGDVMLNLYLALALMTLKLWELASLMGGVLLIVICQVVFIVTVSYFVIFRILGKSYDAAVMCSGLCGHGLGATHHIDLVHAAELGSRERIGAD